MRSLAADMVIDDCVVDDVAVSVLNRHLPYPEDVRIELKMKSVWAMYEEKGADISEMSSQPRIAEEAAVRKYGGMEFKPGWSFDLTRADPATGKPWDNGQPALRNRAGAFVRDTKPFIVIGSPPCTMFCRL